MAIWFTLTGGAVRCACHWPAATVVQLVRVATSAPVQSMCGRAAAKRFARRFFASRTKMGWYWGLGGGGCGSGLSLAAVAAQACLMSFMVSPGPGGSYSQLCEDGSQGLHGRWGAWVSYLAIFAAKGFM